MPTLDFPVNPLRDTLYTRDTLYGNFDPDNDLSLRDTLDFKLFRSFVMEGGATPLTYNAGIMRSLHDNSITEQVEQLRRKTPRIAAIMGGHREERGSPIYRNVCKIAAHLTRSGLLVASGGGPGAMEACHLGAYLADLSDDEIMKVVDTLEPTQLHDDLRNVVKPDGSVDEGLLRAMHAWIRPVFEVIAKYPKGRDSLAIPTFLYGHEPTCPLATHIAKYFQNSLREDGLLAIARHGIIFTKGKAGTIQEVFQDAAQNYYGTFEWFSPMVFLDDDDCWSVTFPVMTILKTLLCADEAHCDIPKYRNRVTITKDWREAASFIERFTPPSTAPKEPGEKLRDL